MSGRTAFLICFLASLATSAQERAPGYIITPSGTIIFPDAPPSTGDTSTFSGAGPSVSAGPMVGPGPEVGTGPVVGEPAFEGSWGRDYAAPRAARLEALDILRQVCQPG